MWTRWSKRLAGSIAISLAAAAGAADFQYQAGTAAIGQTRALAFEDRRGHRAALAQTDAALTLAAADFAAVRILERYDIAREAVLIRGAPAGTPQPGDLFQAIAAALGAMQPAVLRWGEGQLSITAAETGSCRASVTAQGDLRFDACRAGDRVNSPIRAAFRVVEPDRALQQRGQVPPAYPVQAIAFGRYPLLLGIGGAPAGRFRAPRRIVIPYANTSAAPPDSPRFTAAIDDLLIRLHP